MDAHITITSVIMFINNDAYLVRISCILHNVSERFNVDPQICVADRLKASMRQCWSISGQWLLRSSLSCIASKHHQSTWSVHNWYICHVSNWPFSWILGRLPYTNSTPHSWCLNMPQPSWASIWQPLYIYTWWLIPLSKWVITPVISGLTLLIPCKSLGL